MKNAFLGSRDELARRAFAAGRRSGLRTAARVALDTTTAASEARAKFEDYDGDDVREAIASRLSALARRVKVDR